MKELDKTMYFNVTPSIMENARRLRRNMTYNEKLLWEKLNRTISQATTYWGYRDRVKKPREK